MKRHLLLRPSLAILAIGLLAVRGGEGAVALNALGGYLTSRGYGGSQFVRHQNAFRLPINSNGKAGDLTIDTGAPASVIFRQSLKKLNLSESQTDTFVHGVFGKGKDRLGKSTVQSLRMGNCILENVPVGVINEVQAGGLYRRYGSSDGLLGLRELVGFNAVIDVGNRLLFVHPGGRIGNVSPQIRSILAGQGYTAIPMKIADAHLHVPATINGERANLIVDSGSALTCLDRGFASRARIGGTPTNLYVEGLGKGGARPVRVATFPSLRVGDFEIKNASASVFDFDVALVSPDERTEAAGLLGADYLGAHSAVLDFNTLTLFLRAAK